MASPQDMVTLSQDHRNRILNVITEARQNQELTLEHQEKILTEIERCISRSDDDRKEIAKWVSQTWTFQQYNALCILVHGFKYEIDDGKEPGVWQYLRENPELQQNDKSVSFTGAAYKQSQNLKREFHQIQKGGAVSEKFPDPGKWLEELDEKVQEICKDQFLEWKKTPGDKGLWTRADMSCTQWCLPMEWNEEQKRWQQKGADT